MEVPVEFLTSETGRNGHLAALASTAVTSGGRFIIWLSADDNDITSATAATSKGLRGKTAECGSQHENGKCLAEHRCLFLHVLHG